MKNVIKVFSLALLLMIFATQAHSVDRDYQPVGTTGSEFSKVGAAGAQFLKIGVGARANGMAGAFGAVANDLSSIHWNPAGIADVTTMAAEFSYTSWFADFQHNFAAAALPLGDYTIAASLVSFGCDNIPITTIDQPHGTGVTYAVSDVAIGLTFGGYLTDQFSFGITGKYLSNSFASLSSSGIAFDIGTRYETGIYGIRLGFSIHNLGTQMQYSGQDLRGAAKYYSTMNSSPIDFEYLAYAYSIPITFRAGIAGDILDDEDNKLTAAADFVTLSDTPEQFALGAEYTWRNFVSVRAGYLFGNDQFGFSGGFGLKYVGAGFSGSLNYAISPSYDVGWVNRISIAVTVGN